ncbi:MAG: TlyA family RNA methyltransferase [Anaerolineae bacterium]
MAKERLDQLLVERGFAESRARAQALIIAGQVRVNGQVVDKPGTQVLAQDDITVEAQTPFVSRGGCKLAAGLDAFGIAPQGLVAADVGASTGGFTDCLLQRGATKVYAIDVGYGQLAWGLRQDPRVVVMERTNVRYLERLPEPVDLVTIDVSFISLALVLPVVARWLKPHGDIVALVKPQFEVGKGEVGRGGVVRRPEQHRVVLERMAALGHGLGLHPQGLIASPVLGPAGNREFLMHLARRQRLDPEREQCLLTQAVQQAWDLGPKRC